RHTCDVAHDLQPKLGGRASSDGDSSCRSASRLGHQRKDLTDAEGNSLVGRPKELAAAMAEREPQDNSTRERIVDRCPLAGAVREQQKTARAGRSALCLSDELRPFRTADKRAQPLGEGSSR